MEKIINTQATPQKPTVKKPFTIKDFSITELEDRLEMVGRCNGKCA